MKKILLLFLVLSVFIIGNNVYAEDPETLTAGDYEYTVEGFKLRVYPMNYIEDNKTDSESFSKYQSGEFSKEIEIPASDIPFSPTTESRLVGTINTQIVNLHANITEEKLKELLAEEITSANSNENIGYIIELVVNYKVNNAPDKFNKYYEVDFYKELLKQLFDNFGGEDLNFKSNVREVQLSDTITLPVQYIGIEKDNFIFYKTAEETVPPASLYNYVQFSETEFNPDESPTDILMFINVPDIDYLLDQIGEAITTDPEDVDEIDTPTGSPIEIEKIPDTAKDINYAIILVGVLMLLIGSLVVTKIIAKNN